jgi:serine phosphatase RsbU (regulator of sigma subunit)
MYIRRILAPSNYPKKPSLFSITLFAAFTLLYVHSTSLFAQKKDRSDELSDTTQAIAKIKTAKEKSSSNVDSAVRELLDFVKISESKKNYSLSAKAYAAVAEIYASQRNFDKATFFFEKAMYAYEYSNDFHNAYLSCGALLVNLYGSGKISEMEAFCNKSIELATASNNKYFVAQAYYRKAFVFRLLSKFEESTKLSQTALKYVDKEKNKVLEADIYNNLGIVNGMLQNWSQAREYFETALKVFEDLNNKERCGELLNNLSVVLGNMGLKTQELECLEKSLKLKTEVGDRRGVALVLNNLAELVYRQDSARAREYYMRAEKISLEENDKQRLIYIYANRAEMEEHYGNIKIALQLAHRAEEIAKETQMIYEISRCANLLYNLYKKNNDWEAALKYHETFKQTNDSIFNVDKVKSIASLEAKFKLDQKEKEIALLAKDNELNKIYAEAREKELEILRKEAEAKRLEELARAEKDRQKADSLLNLAQKNRLEAENLRIQKENQDLAFKAEREEQMRLQNTYLGAAGTFLIVLVLIGIGFRQKQKANKKLSAKNEEISKQRLEIEEKNNNLNVVNEELKQQHEELIALNESLENQKHQLETTYKQLIITTELLDKSIHYASHIQSVVMPEEKDLRNFFSDLFILFRPRDVVSGDFYWFSQISESHAIFSLADCTGHGVPGAFMSMLGATLLHETVNIKKITDDPARILKNLHHAIRKILKQADKKNNDGMDISLCVFIKKPMEGTVEVSFAGAKSVVSYVVNREIFDLKGDKQYLGGEEMTQDFTNKKLTLPHNTVFYFYTDGFQDQNNPQRQKLGSKIFKSQLLNVADLPFVRQKEKLENLLEDFQAGAKQRDDISVIGLKV